jgi:hypothetical protein
VSKQIWILLVLFILATSPAGAGELNSFLPQSDELAGWTTYQWAQDEDDLYWLINGAGVVYVEHGFQEAVFQKYYDADFIELLLEIYNQGSAANAESTYHDPALEMGWEVPSDNFGVEGRVDTLALDSYKAEFWRDKYFVRGTIIQKNPYGLQTLEAFCQLVDQKLGGKPATDGLPANGEIPDWTQYLTATDSLSLVALLVDEANLFRTGGCTAGLRQDYYSDQFILLQLELFDLGTASNAQSLYHDPHLETGEEIPRTDFGQEGRLDTTSSWTYNAHFWRDRYLARLLIQDKSDSSLADVVSFCQLVDQKIQATPAEGGALTDEQKPLHWKLIQAYPNPFNDHVVIQYRIPQDWNGQQPFQLDIYNVVGQRIRRLCQSQGASPGLHSVPWDGRDDQGRAVASGIYFCSIQYGSVVRTVKMGLCR